MRFFALLFALTLLAAPGIAHGQHGGGDRSEAQRAPLDRGPVDLLLLNRGVLGLSEDQVVRLEAIDRRIDRANRPHVEELMRLRREYRARNSARRDTSSPEYQRYLEQAQPLLEQIRDNNRAGMREVGNVLSEEQKRTVRQMLRNERSAHEPEQRRGRGS